MEIDLYTDQEIAQAILNRNTSITKEFLYKKCYPLFKAVYDKYYTDCDNSIEFINEIYVYIMLPKKDNGRSKLADFGFRCTLTMWLKIVSENYCHQLYARKGNYEVDYLDGSDRKIDIVQSLDIDIQLLNMDDVQKILRLMPNERYRSLIQLRYLDEKSNEETAMMLSLTMANYYNVHLRAKAQFCSTLKKEGLI